MMPGAFTMRNPPIIRLLTLAVLQVSPLPDAPAQSLPTAIVRYEEMVVLAPEAGTAFNRVHDHFLAGSGLDVLAARWLRMQEQDPGNRLAYSLLLGYLAQRRGDLAAAEGYFRDARELNPSDYLGWLASGRLALAQGNTANGVEYLQSAVSGTIPALRKPAIYLELARAQQRNLDGEGAVETYRRLAASFSQACRNRQVVNPRIE